MELVKFMLSLLLVCTVFQSASRDNAYIILSIDTKAFRYLVSSETALSLSSHRGGVNCDALSGNLCFTGVPDIELLSIRVFFLLKIPPNFLKQGLCDLHCSSLWCKSRVWESSFCFS